MCDRGKAYEVEMGKMCDKEQGRGSMRDVNHVSAEAAHNREGHNR